MESIVLKNVKIKPQIVTNYQNRNIKLKNSSKSIDQKLTGLSSSWEEKTLFSLSVKFLINFLSVIKEKLKIKSILKNNNFLSMKSFSLTEKLKTSKKSKAMHHQILFN